MDNEVQKIENIIEVMCQLKQLEKQLRRDYNDQGELLTLILALIAAAEIPEVTLLPQIEDMARA
ncbi:hypothetical protein [uncultured Mediterranean phage uvMED]|nr:hypothetical protein [uncultured Mediterranean phage uvMED]|tara:strand:+ start:3734 stop:3925 length:192 start_codon:yes stop_codon:yes gene_type:complete